MCRLQHNHQLYSQHKTHKNGTNTKNKPLNKQNNNNNNKANAGTRDIGTINSNKRIAATMYSLGILFVSGIYV
jgi:hypothetical protein